MIAGTTFANIFRTSVEELPRAIKYFGNIGSDIKLSKAIINGNIDDIAANASEWITEDKQKNGHTETESKAALKKQLSEAYKETYVDAMLDGDTEKANELRDKLLATGVIEQEDLDSWYRDAYRKTNEVSTASIYRAFELDDEELFNEEFDRYMEYASQTGVSEESALSSIKRAFSDTTEEYARLRYKKDSSYKKLEKKLLSTRLWDEKDLNEKVYEYAVTDRKCANRNISEAVLANNPTEARKLISQQLAFQKEYKGEANNSSIKSAVTSAVKDTYISYMESGNTKAANQLVNTLLGLGLNYKADTINKWYSDYLEKKRGKKQ